MTQLTNISAIAETIKASSEDEIMLIHVEIGNITKNTAVKYMQSVKNEIATYLVENNITKRFIIACMVDGEKTLEIEKITKEEWTLHQLKNDI